MDRRLLFIPVICIMLAQTCDYQDTYGGFYEDSHGNLKLDTPFGSQFKINQDGHYVRKDARQLELERRIQELEKDDELFKLYNEGKIGNYPNWSRYYQYEY